MKKFEVRGLLVLLAGAFSLCLFVGANYYSYAFTRHYEQIIADRLSADLAAGIAELADAGPEPLQSRPDRIAEVIAETIGSDAASQRGWTIEIRDDGGQLVYNRQAAPARFSTGAAHSATVGSDAIGQVEVRSEIYALPSRLAWTSLAALLFSAAVFLVVFWIPLSAIRRREAGLNIALNLATRSERNARASGERLNRAIASMEDGIALYDHDKRLILRNRAFQEIVDDWDLAAELGTEIGELLDALPGDVANGFRTGGPGSGSKLENASPPLELTTPKDRCIEWRHVEVMSGETLILARDLTDQKAVAERLHQAQKMEAVGQLTGGVAHDFNNLLAVIMGNAEILEMRLGAGERPVSAILGASRSGAQLTQRLLAFSRKQPLKPESLDLGRLSSGMLDLLTRSLGETISIDIRHPIALWSAMADSGQVEAAILNLALNARDAMPDGGRLTIECANAALSEDDVADFSEMTPGEYVVLSVSDNGTGMSPKVRAHAFEPFFTTKEVGHGSGLGLPMVYGLAKQSGGHATVDSVEGEGTTITLYLPRARAEPRAEPALRVSDIPRGQGETVLIIEDDRDVRILVSEMLIDLGYRCINAPDAARAREMLARGQEVDLVLSDVVLPGGTSGTQFAEEIRAVHPDVKVIFMSGYPAVSSRQSGVLDEERVLLNKPFQRQWVARALRDELDGSLVN